MSYLTSHSLLRRAHAELDAASGQPSAREQFLGAHMAALRGAAAVLALGAGAPAPKRRKVRSAWVQLAEVGEQWQPWASYYTGSARVRAALESGQLRGVDAAEAGEAIAMAGRFLTRVEAYLGEQEAQLQAVAQAS